MPDTKERLQQAISAARAGNAAEAKDVVELLLQEQPDNPHALFLRGMLAGSQAEQVDYLERVLAVDPDHEAAKRRMAQIAPATDEAPIESVVEEEGEPETEPLAEAEVQEEFGTMETVAGTVVHSELEDEGGVPVEEPAEGSIGEPPEEEPEEPLEQPAEFGVAETIVTAAAVGAELESFDDAATVFEPPPAEADSEPVEVAEEPGEEVESAEAMDATVLATSSVTSEIPEAEAVPDWLKAEAPTEELSALPDTQAWADQPAEEEPEIPAWLSETRTEKEEELPDWLTQEPEEKWTVDEVDKTAIYSAEQEIEPVDEAFEEEALEEPFIEELPAEMVDASEEVSEAAEEIEEERQATSSGTRGLEIALIFLVLVAFVIVTVLLYVIATLVL